MTGLIIAGFHRSGTSSVGQILDSYGMPLGDELMEGNEFNRYGYFESWPVVRFHDQILQRVGADWSTILEELINFTEEEKSWIRDYIERRSAEANDWALKDPRMCRFVQQWKELAPDLKFLIVYRNPADCCQSLIRRSNLEMARSVNTNNIARRFYNETDLALHLWVEHNRFLINLQRRYPDDCVVLGHHHILAGYDIMSVLESRFGILPTKLPEKSTVDLAALSAKRSSLFYKSDVLVEEALEIWRNFERIDIALNEGWKSDEVSSSLLHDPNGQQARAWMADIQLPELYVKLERQLQCAEENKALLKETVPLLQKVSKRPFSLYFMKRSKYRKIIENILLH